MIQKIFSAAGAVGGSNRDQRRQRFLVYAQSIAGNCDASYSSPGGPITFQLALKVDGES